jgi:hypothetical protein
MSNPLLNPFSPEALAVWDDYRAKASRREVRDPACGNRERPLTEHAPGGPRASCMFLLTADHFAPTPSEQLDRALDDIFGAT